MYIYNQLNRFHGESQLLGNDYKINGRKSKKNIKNKPLAVSGSGAAFVNKRKLRRLTKKNITFLTNLGYTVKN